MESQYLDTSTDSLSLKFYQVSKNNHLWTDMSEWPSRDHMLIFYEQGNRKDYSTLFYLWDPTFPPNVWMLCIDARELRFKKQIH